MTPADRKNTFQKIRACLKSGKTCRVVSTSLIEAGVDLDFPTVYREMAGIDSIIQAAGRCNREGTHRWEDSIVWVFRMGEILQMIQKNAVITEETFQKYGKYDDLEAVNYYFSSIQGLDVELLDQYHIIDGFEKGIDGIQMPFEKTAEKFHLINSDTRMLIIPVHAEAAELTCELERRISSGDNFKSILQKLGTYSVNVYEYEYESLIGEGHAYELLDGIAVLQNLLLYSEKMGLKYEKGNEILFV
jgi:CRISPR-associated endonuclease/helicase Cas3